MRHSNNYELNLVEGSDIVNPLVQDVPNYEAIDAAMFDNKEHSVGVATELKTGTVHALTRQNDDAAVFRFTATSDYAVGDTFEVDGVQVSALLVDGTALPNRCYIIGSEVLASLKGTLLTVYANRTTASDSDKLGGQLPAYYAKQSDLDSAEDVIEVHTTQINTLTGALDYIIIASGIHSTGPITIDPQYLTNEYEFKIVTEVEVSNTKHRQSLVVSGADLFNPIMNAAFTQGGYANAQYNEYCQWISRANSNSLTLNAYYINGTDYTNNAYTYVKCRKA